MKRESIRFYILQQFLLFQFYKKYNFYEFSLISNKVFWF